MSPDGRDPIAFVDERLRTAKPLKKALRYIFPDHWSFLLGEMALYSFVVLVGTGIFLAFFFEPGATEVVWQGPYEPLDGESVSVSYASVLDISFKVPGGLLARQTHHWAALIFVVAITMHLLRIVYTGAFRKPREPNYVVGVLMLMLAIFEAYAGYSLLDDLLSGMGLVIGYGVAMSIPGIGGAMSVLIFDGPFPPGIDGDDFFSRLYIVHVLIVPAILAILIGLHLAMIMRQHHTQFPGPGRKETNVVGTPMWPGYALRSLGWFFAVAAVLFLLGGLVQINPIWLWGPYETWIGENGAQPDWFLGWLIGGLRLVPQWDVVLFDRTIIPNPFWGGAFFPLAVFGVLLVLPWIDRRFFTKDDRPHHLLQRPRDNPRRTAWATAFLSFVFLVFFFGSTDRLYYAIGIDYEAQLWAFRVLVFVAPFPVYWATKRWMYALRRREEHPLRGVQARVVTPPPVEDDDAAAEHQRERDREREGSPTA